MATATKEKKTESKNDVVLLKPMNTQRLLVQIEGTSPLIQHKWSEKALRQMREKQGGRKTKNREVRDPESEAVAATYFTNHGDYGLPVTALKKSIIGAAHKDIGIEKTLVRKAIFIICDDKNDCLPMQCDEPIVREDTVRVGAGSADLRYRPEFRKWAIDFEIEIDADLLQPSDVFNLIDRAGFGVGVGEWRPEKGGDNGRFRVKRKED